MDNKTRLLFATYLSTLANLNGVADATQQFNVEPNVSEKIEKRIQDSADFLSKIDFHTVKQLKGDKVGVGVTGSIAGRTDTDANDRDPGNPESSVKDGYECQFTEFDYSIKYARLDAWAHKPDFHTRLRDAIIIQQGLDRIKIGFNGTHVATQTNKTNYPMLEDVNKGWLQKIRDNAPAQHMSGVKIGNTAMADADYKNIDQAVMDVRDLLHVTLRKNPDLVVICASDLVSDKYNNMAGDHEEPTEKEAIARLAKNKKIGGLPAYEAPYFPSGAFLITTFKNLAIYVQEGSRRRQVIDNARRTRIEDYQSVNEDYVVEEYEACAFVEGIQVPNATDDAWEAFSG